MFRKAEILSRIELRQSTIKDWLSCPLMFRYRHVMQLAPSYRSLAAIHGSALHLCIHRLHFEGFDLDLGLLYARALKEVLESESHIPIRWKKGVEEDRLIMLTHAAEILKGYVNHEQNHTSTLMYSEVKFRLRVNGMLLTGTIDQVRRNLDSSLELIDLKSGMQRPMKHALQRDWQLNLYAYALRYGEIFIHSSWVRIRMKVQRTSIYYLRAHEIYKRDGKYGKKGSQKGQPWISVEKPSWELIQFKQELSNIIKMMTRDWAFPNTSSCGFCAYRDHCDDRSMMFLNNQFSKVSHLLPQDEKEMQRRGEI
ncbi:MAG: PD-(D/E)XK nuclease family protein [Candidatus Marinimicrobia bacterium]|nr:PD-(D/E)XK nuclease family protein [Candidatus Neomarinimicrobiota bacterium]